LTIPGLDDQLETYVRATRRASIVIRSSPTGLDVQVNGDLALCSARFSDCAPAVGADACSSRPIRAEGGRSGTSCQGWMGNDHAGWLWGDTVGAVVNKAGRATNGPLAQVNRGQLRPLPSPATRGVRGC